VSGKRAAQAATANAKPTLAKEGNGVAFGPTRWSGTRRAAQENT
jgi:hypothetical protein